MGGGHLTRPDLGMPQADPAHPLTEFYLLLQKALGQAGVFALPALYAGMQAPARRIWADEAQQYLRLSSTPQAGYTKLLGPGQLRLLYCTLHVAPGGAPAALLLTEECTRNVCAVQLLPPFLWDEALPPLPQSTSALALQLTAADLDAADADPDALGRHLARSGQNKRWLRHPKADTFLAGRVALLQKTMAK